MKGWLTSIYKNCEESKPKLLCGNKSDLIAKDLICINDDEA